GRQGRTVVFVSHNMSAVTRLCSRAVLLDRGRVVNIGPTAAIVAEYVFKGLGAGAERRWDDEDAAPGAAALRLLGGRAHAQQGVVQDSFDIRRPIALEITYAVRQPGLRFTPCFDLINEAGVVLFLSQEQPEWPHVERGVGTHVTTCWIPGNFLAEGTFSV